MRTVLRPLADNPARAAALALLLAASAAVIVVLFWQPRVAAPGGRPPGHRSRSPERARAGGPRN